MLFRSLFVLYFLFIVYFSFILIDFLFCLCVVLCIHFLFSVLIARSQAELRAKINELTQKFGLSSTEMERSVRETVVQEMAAEKLREIAAMQKMVTFDAFSSLFVVLIFVLFHNLS